MKKINVALLAVLMLSLGIMTSCKKDKKEDPVTPTEKAKPNDQQGSSEADEAISHVNDVINNKIGGGSAYRTSGAAAYDLPCGVVSLDSTASGGQTTYSMHYGNNSPCGYKKKSGTVSFSRVTTSGWNQAGASITITFTNYVVESVATGAVVTLNGSVTSTNVNGGYIWQVILPSAHALYRASVTHKIRGSFTITYSDNTSRTRSYYQLRTWASSNSWAGLSLTIAGDTNIVNQSLTGVSEMGNTYEGNYPFTTQIINSYIWANHGTTYAGPYVLKTGKAKLNVTVPLLSPTYIEVEGGYKWDYATTGSTPTLVNNTTANAYKITTVLGPNTATQYQLY